MFQLSVSEELEQRVPGFKVGCIRYNHIVISEMPSLISGRLPLFYKNIQLSLENRPFADIPGVREWRAIFKRCGTDPSRYRPSQEALLRKIKRDGAPHRIHSAVDLNNFFSVQHSIPFGIYDLNQIHGPVQITIGSDDDQYDGLNGRVMHMDHKILSKDSKGAFGSPIVDSQRTCVTERTTDALQIAYLRPSMSEDEAKKMTARVAGMFTQIHGGENAWSVVN